MSLKDFFENVNFGKSQQRIIGLDKQIFKRKIVNISLPISFNICFEKVLLSTHNICFGREIRKLNFWYALLTKGLKHAKN